MAEWLSRMGLDLFYPPNVGGWNGGKAWLSTRSLIARTNYAKAIVDGHLCSPTKPMNLTELVSKYDPSDSLQSQARWLALALCNNSDTSLIQAGIKAADAEVDREQQLAKVVMAILTKPEVHLH